ncbi:conserved hypothetical protein [Neospora caninum Liverpool]|uniref:Uncharacterized protein n=1 Tax=Neospora caninum (strain Liverpool) TaxID=572307 RepID=F0VAT1_NEOCL|nr:conserved hypothetical protein [Neospora caninum Liverpool]CBZ51339.1 conserved hypothetical protein [Neospora caninum Liverpool]|eukprot:XP_003881372.1 conserved hypothetical protein [Neospora caninum Liverpool]
MTSAQMIKEIVEGLNKPPFSMKTSLLTFDQEKPAYLAKFLVNIDVPVEFLAKDSHLADAYHEYKELQEKFKIFHSSMEQAQSKSGGFTDCKQEIQRLEKETFIDPQSRLHGLVVGLFISGQGYLTSFLSVARELRMAQVEETTLAFRSQQQTDYFDYLTDQLDTTRNQLQALQALTGDPERGTKEFLEVLHKEERRTEEAFASCVRQLQQKQQRLVEVNEAASGPPPRQETLLELQCELASLQEETRATQAASGEELQLLVEKKKSLEQEVQRKLAAQHAATLKRSAAENEFKTARGYCFMSKEEFATYADMLRQKTNLFKTLKLKEAAAEEANAKAIEDLVRERGVHGFQERQVELKSVDASLAAAVRERTVLSLRGMAAGVAGDVLQRLDEVRSRVEQERKKAREELAPLLEQVDRKKEEEAELKRVYDAKKKAYLDLKAELEKPVESLRATVAALQAGIEALVAEQHESSLECKKAVQFLERAEKEQSNLIPAIVALVSVCGRSLEQGNKLKLCAKKSAIC